LPMHDLPPGVRATIVPGKTYEYLAAGPPILAAVPDGDARDILAEAGALLCRPRDVTCLAETIAQQLERRHTAQPPRRAVGERYEYGRLAGQLADVFARLAPDSGKPLAAVAVAPA